MTRPLSHRPLVFGFHPTSRGFGWAAFENPFTLHSFGVYTARSDKNASCLRKIEWLLERLEPEAFVIEAFDKQSSVRSERIRELCVSVVTLAADPGKAGHQGEAETGMAVAAEPARGRLDSS